MVSSVNGESGSQVEVAVNVINSEEVDEYVTLILEFDASVIQVLPEGVQANPGWVIVGEPEIDNVLGIIRVTVQRNPVKGPAPEGGVVGLLSIGFEVVGPDGAETEIRLTQVMIDGDQEATEDVENGNLAVSGKPARPSWLPPTYIQETAVGLRWIPNAESNLTGYHGVIFDSAGEVLDETVTAPNVTTWEVQGLPGGEEIVIWLAASNANEQSATAELRLETAIGGETTSQNTLFLFGKEWAPHPVQRRAFGIEALLPLAADIERNGKINARDVIEALKLARTASMR